MSKRLNPLTTRHNQGNGMKIMKTSNCESVQWTVWARFRVLLTAHSQVTPRTDCPIKQGRVDFFNFLYLSIWCWVGTQDVTKSISQEFCDFVSWISSFLDLAGISSKNFMFSFVLNWNKMQNWLGRVDENRTSYFRTPRHRNNILRLRENDSYPY